MVPVEAQACGAPVVALGIGGACETVQHRATGILAAESSVEAFAAALDECRRTPFDREAIRANAERFSLQRFLREFSAVVADALQAQGSARPDRACDLPVGQETTTPAGRRS
jgi:glycosyltransferase involved in cell wall biosynthesis